MRRINIRLLLYLAGIVLLTEGSFMLMTLPVALADHAKDLPALVLSGLTTLLTGAFLFLLFRRKHVMKASVRDGFLFVSLVWILVSLFGALPYLFSGAIPRFIDAYFESVSGFTTTGSSILSDIEALSRGILFWRSLTHWIGGLGIILMVIVILPSLKAGGAHLFSAETTRATYDDLRPRLVDTTRRFGLIYLTLTLLEVLFLFFGGMPLFDSVCHSFGTVATGGFSTQNDSIAGYSPYIQYIITAFMFLSGINFALHFLLFRGKIGALFANEEFRAYGLVALAFTFVIALILFRSGSTMERSFRDSLFQVVSVITCTGFGTTDYLLWPPSAWMLLFIAMFVGASAGSTGGGIKVVRHLLIVKNITLNIRSLLHPKMVFSLKYQGNTLSASQISSLIAFYFWYFLIFLAGSLLLVIFGNDFYTSIGSVATTMGGIGPGLGMTGPASNFSMLSGITKLALTFLMIIGRLELYAFLVLFSRWFWKA